MHIFYINLDRRNDRQSFIEDQLTKLGLKAERLSAITPDSLPQQALRFCDEKRDRWVSPVELACTYSHREFWKLVVSRGLSSAIILEDDVLISPRLPMELCNISDATDRLDILRLETRAMPVLLSNDDSWIRKMYSFHFGSAGYAVSNRGAQALLNHEVHDIPVDDFLFSPSGPMFGRLAIRQSYPGFCITIDQLEKTSSQSVSGSDIGLDGSRRAMRLQKSRHQPGLRMLRYGIGRIADLSRDWLRRTIGEARKASWKTVPFE